MKTPLETSKSIDFLKSNILTSFIITLFVGTLLRIIFIVTMTNDEHYIPLEVIQAILVGFIMDSYVLSFFFFPACFRLLFISSHPSYVKWIIEKMTNIYIYIIIFVFLLLSFTDILFFNIYNDRLRLLIIKQAFDIPFDYLISSIFSEYPYGILILPIIFILTYFIYKQNIHLTKFHFILNHTFLVNRLSLSKRIFLLHIIVFLVTSFIYLPPILNTSFAKMTYDFSDHFILQVAARNGPFNLFLYFLRQSRPNTVFLEKDFDKNLFQNLIKGDNAFLNHKKHLAIRKINNPQPRLQTNPHIIMLTVESLSTFFVENTLKMKQKNRAKLPYLKRITQNGMYFPNFYYHWQKSNNAFVSYLFGIPLVDGDLLYSYPNKIKKVALMKLLTTLGYRSLFIHSGYKQIFQMMDFFKEHGGFKVIGYQDFLNPLYTWKEGVSDQEVIERVFLEIQNIGLKNPLFIHIWLHTLHTPYGGVPQTFNVDKICGLSKNFSYYEKDRKLQISLCYVDYVIQQLLEKLKVLMGKNFIVVITGDHRTWDSRIKFQSHSLQRMQVPLIISDQRGLTAKGIIKKVASHQDIPTTLLYMMGYEGLYPFLGQNLLDQGKKGLTVFANHHFYFYRKADYVLEFHRTFETFKLYKVNEQQMKTLISDPELKAQLEMEFKAYMVGLKKWLKIDQDKIIFHSRHSK